MKIFIGGDICPTEKTEELFIKRDGEKLFSDVLPLMKSADRCIINLECALTESNAAITKFGPNLKASPRCADALKEFGVTDVMLANNHVFDFGEEGLKDTVDNLNRVGLNYTGIGKNNQDSRRPMIIEGENKKIGIINTCEHEFSYALDDALGCNPLNPFTVMHDIRELKKQCNFVIVIFHGGKELCRYPSPRLYDMFHEMAENGADVVLSQHSHCIGCYENYNGSHLLHGQGNFNFIESNLDEFWSTSLAVILNIEDKIDIEFIPLKVCGNGITLAKGEDGKDIMTAFQKRNQELTSGKWIDGWREFCHDPKQNYYKTYLYKMFNSDSTERDNQVFSHYTDCEAHFDVWKELFPSWNIIKHGK